MLHLCLSPPPQPMFLLIKIQLWTSVASRVRHVSSLLVPVAVAPQRPVTSTSIFPKSFGPRSMSAVVEHNLYRLFHRVRPTVIPLSLPRVPMDLALDSSYRLIWLSCHGMVNLASGLK